MRNRVSRAQRKSGDAAVVSCAMWRSHLRLVSCVLLNALLRYSNALNNLTPFPAYAPCSPCECLASRAAAPPKPVSHSSPHSRKSNFSPPALGTVDTHSRTMLSYRPPLPPILRELSFPQLCLRNHTSPTSGVAPTSASRAVGSCSMIRHNPLLCLRNHTSPDCCLSATAT